jgi:hypothetical protein
MNCAVHMGSSATIKKANFRKNWFSHSTLISGLHRHTNLQAARRLHWPYFIFQAKGKKRTPWPLVRKRTIPTERPPLVDEIS